MGRQTAADVVAAGASAIVIGQDPAKVDDTVTALVNAAGLCIPQPWNIDGGVTAGHN